MQKCRGSGFTAQDLQSAQVLRREQLKAFQGLAGSPRGWDRLQGLGVREMESQRLAAPIRQASWARIRGLRFPLSLMGSL